MSNGTITKSRSYTYGTDGMLATRTLPGGGHSTLPHAVTVVDNGQPLYSKFYWDDYEEKTVDNTTYLYWYVNGGDGLAGIIKGIAQNSSWSLNLAAITDHLGSIMALWDNNDPYYSCSYDVWGNRTIGMWSYPVYQIASRLILGN